jgi:hypothetical protein
MIICLMIWSLGLAFVHLVAACSWASGCSSSQGASPRVASVFLCVTASVSVFRCLSSGGFGLLPVFGQASFVFCLLHRVCSRLSLLYVLGCNFASLLNEYQISCRIFKKKKNVGGRKEEWLSDPNRDYVVQGTKVSLWSPWDSIWFQMTQ